MKKFFRVIRSEYYDWKATRYWLAQTAENLREAQKQYTEALEANTELRIMLSQRVNACLDMPPIGMN